MCVYVQSYIMRCLCTCESLLELDVFCRCLRMCACACAHVCLIALVTQAFSHSHCSKLWVGEGHCGADRGDREERGDGGWVGEKETEEDDNEKLKAVRKWDVGLLRTEEFAAKKCASPRGLKLFLPLSGESISFLGWGQRPLSLRPWKYLNWMTSQAEEKFIPLYSQSKRYVNVQYITMYNICLKRSRNDPFFIRSCWVLNWRSPKMFSAMF